jgi:DNA-binding NtrC family response regulator
MRLAQRSKSDQHIELVGESAPMLELAGQIERVAPSKVTVAIVGESGTGKELVARAIHHRGPRAQRPFVAINCAAIPEFLQESELFGHERGAFTGATHTRLGCFEQANGGTLLLDELGEMSRSTQARLLRTLQERTIRRVGGSTELAIDVRILCATQRDLRAEVAAGRFREDLYFRLVVFPIEVPPLRERRGDVESLVAHAIRQLHPESALGVGQDALEALDGYSWPGNVRELFNVVHRGLLACKGDELTLADLPEHVRGTPPRSGIRPLQELERTAIEHALKACGGAVTAAAEMLGVSRATLYRRIRDFRAVAAIEGGVGGNVPPSSSSRLTRPIKAGAPANLPSRATLVVNGPPRSKRRPIMSPQ